MLEILLLGMVTIICFLIFKATQKTLKIRINNWEMKRKGYVFGNFGNKTFIFKSALVLITIVVVILILIL